MQTRKLTLTLGLILATAIAGGAAAQTRSGGRQGPNGHGYTYNVTKSGSTVTGSVETNAGYGGTVNHTGGVSANGVRTGTTTVTTNNGSSLTTHAAAYNGAAAGTVSATGPNGQTVKGGGAIYVPY